MAIQNATGHTYKDKFNERIWSKVGVKNQFMVPLTSDTYAVGGGLVNTGVEDSLKYAMMYTPSWNVVSQKGLLHLKSYKEYVPLAIPQLMWFGKKHTALSEQEKKLVGK